MTIDADVAAFWQDHPCGDEIIGGLGRAYQGDYEAFFTAYDRARYRLESHIPGCLDRLAVSGLEVLEIGLGEGAESEQLIRRGAVWSGVDVTEEAVSRVRSRLELRRLPHQSVLRASVTELPAHDEQFDLVFSHGVLHHVADIQTAQREIHRVLRPGGRLVVMLYARRSLNYQVSIRVLRRAALLAAWPFRGRVRAGMLAEHLASAQQVGLLNYLQMERFLSANTDGPKNPLARVYDLRDVARDFPLFEVTVSQQYFMHAPPLPVHGWPGAGRMGWHLWVEMRPR
jgi:ubiquinone/menaquinone biosynthesis C-methylase UbiE